MDAFVAEDQVMPLLPPRHEELSGYNPQGLLHQGREYFHDLPVDSRPVFAEEVPDLLQADPDAGFLEDSKRGLMDTDNVPLSQGLILTSPPSLHGLSPSGITG